MAKKKRQLVTGKHAKTYDREFRQYLNMYHTIAMKISFIF